MYPNHWPISYMLPAAGSDVYLLFITIEILLYFTSFDLKYESSFSAYSSCINVQNSS